MLYISNFVLELNNIIMNKIKTMLILMLAGTVTFTIGLWLYSTKSELSIIEYTIAGLVLVVVVFSLFIGFKRLKDVKKGIPPEDELSVKIKQKAAANAFAFSFYLWTLIVIFIGDKEMRPTIPIGIGILATGILFLGLWAYYSKTGLGNGDTN